jgi:hypothetical protein
MSFIQANADTLLRQASITADQYLHEAITAIDKKFAKGYAKDHPNLIAAFMKVAASDMNNATFAKAQSEAIESLAESLSILADKISGIMST